MRKLMIISGWIVACLPAIIHGQGKYLTKEGIVSFYSHTVIEDIKADHHEVASIIDSETGEVVINVKMTAFQFEKKLMQEHFNENYVESEKYPKATFNGTINNNIEVDYAEPGSYEVQVEGDMTIHGKTNTVRAEGTVEVTTEGIVAKTKFLLNPEDYGIKIPRVVRKNIAENMEIIAELVYKPM